MGFFKDLKKLQETSKDLEQQHDVGEALANAQAQMAAATEGMQAAADLAKRGERAKAQVVNSRATGMMLNMAPMLEVDLMVFREGKPPYPATATMSSAAGFPSAGQEMSVLVDPDDQSRVAIG